MIRGDIRSMDCTHWQLDSVYNIFVQSPENDPLLQTVDRGGGGFNIGSSRDRNSDVGVCNGM